MCLNNVVPYLIFEKRGVLALIALESLSTIMNRGIVVVKLGFVDCRKGTAITEEGLPICEVFAPLLKHSMYHPHVCQQGLVPFGGVVT